MCVSATYSDYAQIMTEHLAFCGVCSSLRKLVIWELSCQVFLSENCLPLASPRSFFFFLASYPVFTVYQFLNWSQYSRGEGKCKRNIVWYRCPVKLKNKSPWNTFMVCFSFHNVDNMNKESVIIVCKEFPRTVMLQTLTITHFKMLQYCLLMDMLFKGKEWSVLWFTID